MNTSMNYDHVYTTVAVARKKPFQCSMLYELNTSLEQALKGIAAWRKSIMCPANAFILDKGVSYMNFPLENSSLISVDRCGCGVRLTDAPEDETISDKLKQEKRRWPLTAKFILRFLVNPRIKKMLKNNQRKYQGRLLGCNYTIALHCLDALFGKGVESS